MEVILLQKIRNLGDVGGQVTVRAGYARNYLLPFSKAVLANKENVDKFAKMYAELKKKEQELLQTAVERKTKLENLSITIPVKATEDGQMFGSVNLKHIMGALKDAGFEVQKSEINLPQGAIRCIGKTEIQLILHTDVTVKIKVNIDPSNKKKS